MPGSNLPPGFSTAAAIAVAELDAAGEAGKS